MSLAGPERLDHCLTCSQPDQVQKTNRTRAKACSNEEDQGRENEYSSTGGLDRSEIDQNTERSNVYHTN